MSRHRLWMLSAASLLVVGTLGLGDKPDGRLTAGPRTKTSCTSSTRRSPTKAYRRSGSAYRTARSRTSRCRLPWFVAENPIHGNYCPSVKHEP